MTQDEVIEMADKADDLADAQLQMKGEFHPDWHTVRDEAFAKLVAAKEREACAKLIEEMPCDCCWPENSISVAEDFAEAIRARGEV